MVADAIGQAGYTDKHRLTGGIRMRKASISRLPAGIREGLVARFHASGFCDYDAHAEWLRSVGYDISKSAVHRFGQQIEAEGISPERLAIIQLRLRCLEVAASANPGSPDVKEKADELVEWVGLD